MIYWEVILIFSIHPDDIYHESPPGMNGLTQTITNTRMQLTTYVTDNIGNILLTKSKFGKYLMEKC